VFDSLDKVISVSEQMIAKGLPGLSRLRLRQAQFFLLPFSDSFLASCVVPLLQKKT
jgi:hypothetical protein